MPKPHEYVHLTVAAVCQRNGRFLMVEERPKGHENSVFNQPAGHIEVGESLTEAVKRETLEETGWQFIPEGLTGLYQYRAPNGVDYTRVCFFGSIDEKAEVLTDLDPDILAAHWLSADEILNHPRPRSPLVNRCLQDYLDGKHYPLEFLYSATI